MIAPAPVGLSRQRRHKRFAYLPAKESDAEIVSRPDGAAREASQY
jgi:hypothetical protein